MSGRVSGASRRGVLSGAIRRHLMNSTLSTLTSEDRASPADSKGSLTGCFIGLGVGGSCPDMLATVGLVSCVRPALTGVSALPNLGGILVMTVRPSWQRFRGEFAKKNPSKISQQGDAQDGPSGQAMAEVEAAARQLGR